jgi:chaperonin GroEL
VLVERLNRWEAPEVMDDGASLARRIIELPLYRNTGGMLMRHAVGRVLDEVGDGTATTAVIAQALVRETTRLIASGANPAILRKGIETGLIQALEALDEIATPLDDLAQLGHVALAAGHDECVAEAIVAIHRKHGRDIVIALQDWMANEVTWEVADGTKWDAGFASSNFITDQPRNLAWSEKPYLLFTDVFVDAAEQIVPIMQQIASIGGKQFVVIAPKIAESALATLLVNNQQGTLHSIGIISPGDGAHRVGVLQDLAAQTGGRFLSSDAGDRIEFADVNDLGECDLVWASRDFFSIIGGHGHPDDIADRAAAVRNELENVDAPFDRENLRKRLGHLTGGLATLNIGAATKTEMAERKVRAERSVKAVEAARKDGVVPGGGMAYLACGRAICVEGPSLEFDERLGREALIRALEEPLRAIAENAGAEPEPILHAVKRGGGRLMYDAVRSEVVDVGEAGIIDPVNVARSVLRHSVSAAVMLIMTEALVIPKYRYLHANANP